MLQPREPAASECIHARISAHAKSAAIIARDKREAGFRQLDACIERDVVAASTNFRRFHHASGFARHRRVSFN
ncbi:hypothetical protein BGLA2_700057 [Burkholderia gladioli]|nr:hypothetical protein BGLA2_700057 [Burkholderia gladioli]